MATFRQVAKDYAKDHGFSGQEVVEQIRDGKLDGEEDDNGVLYVIFEVEENPAIPEAKNTSEKENKLENTKSGVSTFSGIIFTYSVRMRLDFRVEELMTTMWSATFGSVEFRGQYTYSSFTKAGCFLAFCPAFVVSVSGRSSIQRP